MAENTAFPTATAETPATRLRQARIAAGFAEPNTFASSFNLSPAAYGDHEAGFVPIDPPEALRYAHLLGNCLVGWILTGAGLGPSFAEKHGGMEGGLLRRRRFAVARKAYWSDVAQAAHALGVTTMSLMTMEDGGDDFDDDVALRFCGLTHCPREWIEAGVVDRMEPALLCRIALLAPELLPRRSGDLASCKSRASAFTDPVAFTLTEG
jgi:hypothetical protein